MYLTVLNVAEIYSSGAECRGPGDSSSIKDNRVHYHSIFTRNHYVNIFIFFVLNTERNSLNASNKVFLTTEEDGAVSPREEGTG